MVQCGYSGGKKGAVTWWRAQGTESADCREHSSLDNVPVHLFVRRGFPSIVPRQAESLEKPSVVSVRFICQPVANCKGRLDPGGRQDVPSMNCLLSRLQDKREAAAFPVCPQPSAQPGGALRRPGQQRLRGSPARGGLVSFGRANTGGRGVSPRVTLKIRIFLLPVPVLVPDGLLQTAFGSTSRLSLGQDAEDGSTGHKHLPTLYETL